MARIYISSTREDLQNEREEAAKAVRRLGHQAIYMEDYVASNLSPLQQCLQDVERCAVYVGIFAFRYGFIPPRQKKSITHLEYEAAVKAGIPCLIFILDPDAPHKVKFVAKGEEGEKIDQLRRELTDKYVVSFFKNAKELGNLVGTAVSKSIFYQPKRVMTPPDPPIKNNGMAPSPTPPVKPKLEKEINLKPLIPWLAGALAVLVVIFVGILITQKPTPSNPSMSGKTSVLTVNGVAYDMVEIPGGAFQMGTNNGDSDECPVHTVQVSGFRIGKTEVTQKLWLTVMGNNPSHFKKGNNYPVENISWYDCCAFIQKLNRRTGENYRLPTETEWEYTCRAGTTRNYYGPVNDIGWHDGNSNKSTHPVGYKKKNAFYLYDMSGNVWEWCQDYYGLYDSIDQKYPNGPSSGSFRVIRGGGWYFDVNSLRSAHRYWNSPRGRNSSIGFRLASSLIIGG